jgi:hypothetical protein
MLYETFSIVKIIKIQAKKLIYNKKIFTYDYISTNTSEDVTELSQRCYGGKVMMSE